MTLGVDPAVERACRHVAAVLVSGLVAFTLGMWILRGTLLPDFAVASLAAVAVLALGERITAALGGPASGSN